MTSCANKNNRRHFLRQLAAGIACGGMANMRLPLSLMGTSLMANKSLAADNYRALVCVYLFGGNDSWNLLVPRDTTRYNQYAAARGNLAVPQNDLRSIAGNNYGIHPSCLELQTLFNQNKLAFITNVGTLAQPLNKPQYLNNSVPKPPQLFSHFDQTRLWHAGSTDLTIPHGWGGRFADKLQAQNQVAKIPLAISTGGQDTQFVVGANTFPYPIEGRAVHLFGQSPTSDYYDFGGARHQALMDMLALTYDNQPFEKEYSKILQRSIDLEAVLNPALDAAAADPITTNFPSSRLGDQLKVVAKLIQVRETLGLSRQIFLVGIDGFDLHADLVAKQPGQLKDISDSISAFYTALGESSINAQNEVTLFTMSEFGRTLSSNGQGSDHAWGGNQLVVGGAVNGGALYGTFPTLTLNGPDTLERGQVIPTTSVDQMAATLGKWMGVDASDLQTIFPNLANFPSSNLEFMKP